MSTSRRGSRGDPFGFANASDDLERIAPKTRLRRLRGDSPGLDKRDPRLVAMGRAVLR